MQKLYVETYVRNNPSLHTRSADTIFRRIRDAESLDINAVKKDHPDHERFQYIRNTGSRMLSDLIDSAMKSAISIGYSHESVNMAIDHDRAYYGMYNPDLISAPYHKYRGTDMAYRFATLESLQNGFRLTLSAKRKTPLDGIDNASETGVLTKNAMDLEIKIGFFLMDRGYLDADVVKTVDDINLKYIIPARDNTKVNRFNDMEMHYSDSIRARYLIIRDTICSGRI